MAVMAYQLVYSIIEHSKSTCPLSPTSLCARQRVMGKWFLKMLTYFIACVTFARLCQGRVSFTADGSWEPVKDDSCNHFLCTTLNETWVPNYPQKYYNNVTACDALVNKGIKKIFFFGDSYMRQMYAALLITLKGDYRYGSIASATNSPECEYGRQFFEKRCGTRELNHYGIVCDGRIVLDPLLHGINNLNHCQNEKGTVNLWSFGNYKLGNNGREGVNNATSYINFFQRDICPLLKVSEEQFPGDFAHPCSTWWISTHHRLRAYFDDEKPEVVKEYNRGMRAFHDSGACGPTNYIDVWNMTNRLSHEPDAEHMTYDGVHWGMEGNMVKAQIIINALLSN